MNKMKRLTGRKILLVAVAFCAFGFAKAQDTQTEKPGKVCCRRPALPVP